MGIQRKEHRLSGYDYSRPGAYFVTLCVKEKRNLFWDENAMQNHRMVLTDTAHIAIGALEQIPEHYPNTAVDLYAIMPDHIHVLLVIKPTQEMNPPDLGRIIRQFKGVVTKQLGYSPWQKLYFERIIRNEEDYWITRRYIRTNPEKRLNKQDSNPAASETDVQK